MDVAAATLRAAAAAEGVDTGQPWVDAAAAQISVSEPTWSGRTGVRESQRAPCESRTREAHQRHLSERVW